MFMSICVKTSNQKLITHEYYYIIHLFIQFIEKGKLLKGKNVLVKSRQEFDKQTLL